MFRSGAWARVHALCTAGAAGGAGAVVGTSMPPLLYAFAPTRPAAAALLVRPLNPQVGTMYHRTCRWGGCHPSRGEPTPEWAGWLQSAPCDEQPDVRACAAAAGDGAPGVPLAQRAAWRPEDDPPTRPR